MDRGRAYRAILLFGLVSLLGDMVYEGARSIVPPYLKLLGASALVVGLAGGLGELLGYGFRLVSGYLADATRAYWLLIFLGYGMLAAVPLLSAAWSWPVAVALVLAERLAKGLRSPARDAVLASVSRSVGYGKAFGLHELLDQAGAVGGPALVTFLLLSSGYRTAFAVLAAPYAALMLVLTATYRYVGPVEQAAGRGGEKPGLPGAFKLYTAAVMLNTLGLMHVSLLLYRLSGYMEAWMVSASYLAAMGVDAVAAPLAGLAYDRVGLRVLLLPFVLSAAPSILGLVGGGEAVLVGVLLFGVILGLQESVYRAAVASMVSEGRGMAYGVFNTVYGLGFAASGAAYGLILEKGAVWTGVLYALAAEILALALLWRAVRAAGG